MLRAALECLLMTIGHPAKNPQASGKVPFSHTHLLCTCLTMH